MKRLAIAAACLTLLAPQSPAGTMVQSSSFRFLSNGTSFSGYDPFPAALGPLNSVGILISASGFSEGYTIANMSAAPVVFHVTTHDFFTTDAGGVDCIRTILYGLEGHASTSLSYAVNDGYPFVVERLFTTGLSLFTGTGTIPVFRNIYPVDEEWVTADNSAIKITYSGIVPQPAYVGTETVTYYYGPTLGPAPAPASLLLLSCGLVPVAFLRRS